MRKSFTVLDTVQRARVLSTLLLLTLGATACGAAANHGDPEAVPGDRSSIAVRDGRIPSATIVCDVVAVLDGGITGGAGVTIPRELSVRRESEARRSREATAESQGAGFFARVLKPLLLRVARQIIAFQFRELIPGGTS